MKKVKKYLGRKIRIVQDMNNYNNNILKEENIITLQKKKLKNY